MICPNCTDDSITLTVISSIGDCFYCETCGKYFELEIGEEIRGEVE